jgi:hypothetical protein
MVSMVSQKSLRHHEFLAELLAEISDPLHKRLVEAYGGDDPVQSMEAELCQILMEVVHREDKKPDGPRISGIQ